MMWHFFSCFCAWMGMMSFQFPAQHHW
jgi:hypothetical protein